MPFRTRHWAAFCGVLILAVLAGGLMVHWRHRSPESRPTAAASVTPAKTAPAAPSAIAANTNQQEVQVPSRSNFIAACAPFHLDTGLLQQLIKVARPVYNLARIQAGNTLTLVRSASGELKALSYQIDDNHRLWLRPLQTKAVLAAAPEPVSSHAAVTGVPPAWTASIQTIPYETRVVGVSGTVQSSLFQAVEDAGEQDQLALDVANIFGWDLDFYTDPRQGDIFRVLIEKKYLNGKFAHYGQIVAAEYVNGGQPFDAVRFHDEFGTLAYYRPDGRPMKRAFLRSPLKFAARISSGFSRHRFHPILKVYRAHLGIDFAAPTGTPVQTIGARVVTYAGRKGGDGNMVQIRHSGGYQTLYLHLSRILVHVGERVAQGERIGLVGMTGLATGPHLDFRIEHNGEFENFEVLRKSLPPAEPVSPKLLPQFHELTAHYMPQLTALQPATATAKR